MSNDKGLALIHGDGQALSSPGISGGVFSSIEVFENSQRMAKALACSDLVPESYRNNIANALIALEIAQRIGCSPLMVMQNLNIIHGRPSWSSTFIAAAINSCGRFEPLKFALEGKGDDRGCYAWTTARGDAKGERLSGTRVTIGMAKAEGWTTRKGSKWITMPDLMLQYRAATFFGRMYAPDVLMGMRPADEHQDIESSRRAEQARRVIQSAGNVIDTHTGEVLVEAHAVAIETPDELDDFELAMAGATPVGGDE